jgi:hypothetical protein
MKTSELKNIIKEAVREAIQAELKDILLEAIKTPKQVVNESFQPYPGSVNNTIPTPSPLQPSFNAREKYANILGETAMSFTSNDVAVPFNPHGVDPINGSLGNGELGMDQIMGLLNQR